MSLWRRLEYLEIAKRRRALAAGKAKDSGIGPATAAFIRQLRGANIDENDIRILPNVGLNNEGVSEAVIHFIEELRRV